MIRTRVTQVAGILALAGVILGGEQHDERGLRVAGVSLWTTVPAYAFEHIPAEARGCIHIRPGGSVGLPEEVKPDLFDVDSYIGFRLQVINVRVVLESLSERDEKNVEVRLSVTPKVSPWISIDEEGGFSDTDAMKKQAAYFVPLSIESKTIDLVKAGDIYRVTFEGFDLRKAMKRYEDKGCWLIGLRFEACVEPVSCVYTDLTMLPVE